MPRLQTKQFRSEKGFTLVEILVAISIFVIVMTIATGAFVNMMKVQRRVNAKTEALQDLRQVTELMVRDIRTGQVTRRDSDELEVINQKGDKILYELSPLNNEIVRAGKAITGERVNIRKLLFTGDPDSQITIFISAFGIEEAGAGTTEDEINIQTSVTSR
ncbi:type II secretion system protein J [Patescibacteria group bacterium]